jgi:hypothetical protein
MLFLPAVLAGFFVEHGKSIKAFRSTGLYY